MQSENDCVHISMIAHFNYQEDDRKTKNANKEARFSISGKRQYFDFPKGLPTPIPQKSLEKIARDTKTEMWLYQVTKQGKKYNVRFLRKQIQPFDLDRTIY